jgi:DNA-binding FrmR family transcriptional regulator
MSMLAYFKPAHDDIEKLIKEHVKKCRRTTPWDGEHKQVVKDIVKIFKRLT